MTKRNRAWNDIHAKFYLFGYQRFVWKEGERPDWHIGFFGISESEASPEYFLAVGGNDDELDFFVNLFFVQFGYYCDEDTGEIKWVLHRLKRQFQL